MKSTIDMIQEISFELKEAYRGKIANIGGAVVSTAYVLSKIAKIPTVSADSLEKFLKTADIAPDVSEVLSRNLNGLWETVQNYIDRFNADALEEVILYDNSFFEMSTPVSLVKLADRVLNINEHDKILDICSGCATFPVYAFQNAKANEYMGVEINYNLNDIAILRASLLDANYTFVINNALTYNFPENYDKIFSNYPFALRGTDLDESRRELQKYFGLDNSCISRCSSDWLFNATIIRYLKKTGKAVAIMTNGATFNKPDMYMRKFFVENGYIETVINLPEKMFADTGISTTMIVFSSCNRSIKLINASHIYSKKYRRLNIFSDEDIDRIVNYISSDNNNTVVLSPAEMREHEYNLMATHYLDKPVVKNGVCFGEIVKNIARGSQVKPELLESYKSITPTNYRFISLANIVNGSLDIEEGQQYITELPKVLEKFVIPDNSIVLSKMASPTFRSAVVNSDNSHSIIATGNLYIIEVDETKADPYYIQAFFDSTAGETALNYASGGSVVKTISAEAVKNIMIPLPPLDEQKRIAQKYQASLDEYNMLKRKMKKAVERKRTLLEREG